MLQGSVTSHRYVRYRMDLRNVWWHTAATMHHIIFKSYFLHSLHHVPQIIKQIKLI